MEEIPRQADRGSDPNAVAGVRRCEASPRAWTLNGQWIALEVDLSIYSAEAIRRAGYKLTDRCFVFLAPGTSEGTLVACLAPKSPQPATYVEELMGEFANEVLDQKLRESLAEEFGPIQALITEQAFGEANLLDPERDEGDYRTDPRGIGRRR
jgi:His-Xaa-Ser system protein HxsD